MVLVHNFALGMICCLYCCICWGSWGNTQKLVKKKDWDYTLFYWDYILGFLLTALLGAVTLGSLGNEGVSFFENLGQASWSSIGWAVLGGVIWGIANTFLSSAIDSTGMSIAFPIGGGLGWIGGVLFNYLLVIFAGQEYAGNELMLWIGLVFGVAAIVLCSRAYGKLAASQKTAPAKGIILALVAGIGFMFFYGLVVKSIDPAYVAGGTGSLTPYSGVFFFAVGAVLVTLFTNTFAMAHPKDGAPKVKMIDWIKKGDLKTHLIGMLGGFIWMSGMVISFMATGAGNPAVNYALSNASPVVAMFWGVFIWKEFKDAPKGTNRLVAAMFTSFVIALVVIALSN